MRSRVCPERLRATNDAARSNCLIESADFATDSENLVAVVDARFLVYLTTRGHFGLRAQRLEGVDAAVCVARKSRQVDFEAVYEANYEDIQLDVFTVWTDSRKADWTPYPEKAMVEWRDNTMLRLKRYCELKRVLEIGCGEVPGLPRC